VSPDCNIHHHHQRLLTPSLTLLTLLLLLLLLPPAAAANAAHTNADAVLPALIADIYAPLISLLLPAAPARLLPARP
jgi:hypothetical protein